jgi:hypothetical protein
MTSDIAERCFAPRRPGRRASAQQHRQQAERQQPFREPIRRRMSNMLIARRPTLGETLVSSLDRSHLGVVWSAGVLIPG